MPRSETSSVPAAEEPKQLKMSGTVKSLSPLGTLSYLTNRHCHSDEHLRKKFVRDRLYGAQSLFKKNLTGHYGCVNAIEFSNGGGQWIVSGGDDRRIMLWNAERALDGHGQPQEMQQEHNSNIFALAFDHRNDKIFSGGNDEIVIVHDIKSGRALDVYRHEDAVYGLAADPLNDSVFASACADGRVLIYDIRAPASEDPFCLANYIHPMHGVMYNPLEPRLLVTANSREGVGLWDIRKPRTCVLRYGTAQQSCMSVRFNHGGTHLLALRRRLSPVLYATHSPKPVYQFDHPGYLNSCTMKSCSFAGENDQFVLSGSDDFNLYMWKIPEGPSDTSWVGEAHMVLRGHRSVVNQVRSNPSNQMIISSGVEKIIKIWSPFPVPRSRDKAIESHSRSALSGQSRPIYTHEEYINLVRRSGAVMSHDYTNQSIEEDPCMMAFFDSLIQRELEGWSSSDDNNDFDSEPEYIRRFAAQSDLSLGGSDTPNNESEEEEQGGGGPLVAGEPNPFTIAFASLMARQELAGNDSLELNLSLADDLFNRREEHRPAAPGGQGSGSSGSQNPAGHTDARDGESLTMPGQRPIPNRRSISDLIALKRKEYLATMKKASERQAKKRKLQRAKKLSKATKAKKRRLVEYSGNEGSSESSDSESGSPVGKFSSSSSTSSSSEIEQTPQVDIGEIYTKLSSDRLKHTAELQKLKQLRSRVLQSDSDSDTAGISGHNQKDRVFPNQTVNPSLGKGRVCSESAESVSSPGQFEGGCGDDPGREIGPHLAEALFDVKIPPTSQSKSHINRHNCHLANDNEASTSFAGRVFTNSQNAGEQETQNSSIEPVAGTSCTSDRSSVRSNIAQNGNNLVLSTTSNPSEVSSGIGQEGTDPDSSNTTWEEFKKLRRKVKRHYRRQSQQQQESRSSEEDA